MFTLVFNETETFVINLFTDRDLSLETGKTYPSTRLFTNFSTTKYYNVHSLRYKKKTNSRNMPNFFYINMQKRILILR